MKKTGTLHDIRFPSFVVRPFLIGNHRNRATALKAYSYNASCPAVPEYPPAASVSASL